MKRPEIASDNTGEISVMRVKCAGRLQKDQQRPVCLRTGKLGRGKFSGISQEHLPLE